MHYDIKINVDDGSDDNLIESLAKGHGYKNYKLMSLVLNPPQKQYVFLVKDVIRHRRHIHYCGNIEKMVGAGLSRDLVASFGEVTPLGNDLFVLRVSSLFDFDEVVTYLRAIEAALKI